MRLTRTDLPNTPATSPEASSSYLITRIEWVTGGANHFASNQSVAPVRAVIHITLDDESNVLHCGFDGFARLCGSMHVIAHRIGARTEGDVQDLEPGDTLVFVDPTFRTVTLWHRPSNGSEAKETTIPDRVAERIAREWWTDCQTGGATHSWATLKALVTKYKAEAKGKT